MSMSTHIKGIKLPNNTWKKMKKVWDACKEIDIDPPKEVLDFFNYDIPNSLGVEIDIKAEVKDGDGEVTYTVYLDKLPKDINAIQFINSW